LGSSLGGQYHAVHAQRAFRGYYSRRYRHDYNARKAYILSVVEKGEQLRARLQEHLRAQRDGAARAMKGDAEQEFAEVTANLHHLVSTKNIPGVYNSPYMQDNLPAALGRPIEVRAARARTEEGNPTKSSLLFSLVAALVETVPRALSRGRGKRKRRSVSVDGGGRPRVLGGRGACPSRSMAVTPRAVERRAPRWWAESRGRGVAPGGASGGGPRGRRSAAAVSPSFSLSLGPPTRLPRDAEEQGSIHRAA
jgi:hypothetical protein